MKQGEKRAFLGVLIAFVGVLIFTVYYEIQYQKREPVAQPERKFIEQGNNTGESPGIWVIPAGLNPRDLPDPDSRGATMLLLYCVQCHDLPTPSMHTQEEWKRVLQRMNERMQSRRGGVLMRIMMPPEKDWQILTNYLLRYAQIPADISKLTNLDSPGGQAFQSSCSLCHAAPDPTQHLAAEWPRIVLRMKSNMQSAGKPAPDDASIELIIKFLQDHSKTQQI